jgi:uncharacterized protein DUF1592/uncharacterized protein DUF1588/uncharacterized protein DUF1587/uncharacterized protein DUF1585/uncharacterized protein DUF1595
VPASYSTNRVHSKRILLALAPVVYLLAAAKTADPGRVTARRLNRAEYNYSIHDLLGIDFQPADDFPQDDSGYGFDNIGDVLSLSPVLMEHYMNAAEKAAHLALFGPRPMRATMMGRYRGAVRPQPLEATPLMNADATGLSKPTALHARHRFPIAAEYAFVPTVGGNQTPGIEMKFGLWIDGQKAATLDAVTGKRAELRAGVSSGEHTISVSYIAPTRAGRINQLEIDGPYGVVSAPSEESLRRIYVCGHYDGHHGPACERRILSALARRAFRRPVTKQEADRFAGFVALAQSKGDSFEEGLAVAMEAILVSPNFLFRIENHPKAKSAQSLTPLEIASRLSYFLWSSIPDEELLHAAETGSLRKPAVLEAQVRRMLKDEKSSRLAENFADQWLEIRRLESVKPDAARFPEFDDLLRYSMRRETELFFAGVMRNDRSILDFLDGKYSYLNQRLAAFYGIAGVEGPEFRQVDLSGQPRAGVLTQASVLTVSSYANRTSPVLRGKWVLENLLNTPPPPPPPDVPNLDEAALGKDRSMRQQLEMHRTNPVCAACHNMMDPLGFGLENFNAVGQWRDSDGAFPIDSSGTLPGGRKFQGPIQLEAILRAKPDSFARCLTEKMMTYALGRGLTEDDKLAVQHIVSRVAAGGYRFSTLVLEIVNSPEFQMQGAADHVRQSE